MNRRSVIKSMGLAMGGMMSLPAWASGWSADTLGYVATLSAADEALLGHMVNAIIPETTYKGKASPGARELKVHQFVIRMVNDCYDEQAQKNLVNGLKSTEAMARKSFSKSFAQLTSGEQVAVFTSLTNSSVATDKQFISMVKNLTIQGYTNSEYYLTTIAGYVMAPGFYKGCVPLSQ